jgi:hypothetical protein
MYNGANTNYIKSIEKYLFFKQLVNFRQFRAIYLQS